MLIFPKERYLPELLMLVLNPDIFLSFMFFLKCVARLEIIEELYDRFWIPQLWDESAFDMANVSAEVSCAQTKRALPTLGGFHRHRFCRANLIIQ